MRRTAYFITLSIVLASLLASGAVLAQTPAPARDIPRGGEGASVGAAPISAPSAGTISARDNSSSIGMAPSYSGGYTPSVRTSIPGGGYSASGGSGGGAYGNPNYGQFINERTSFYNYDNYFRSTMLFDLLRLYYGSAFSRQYFSRYYINNEPILNTKMLHYSLRSSVTRAEQLTQTVSELKQLLWEYQRSGAGESAAFRDPRWNTLLSRVRNLAKQIRNDEFLPYVDIRKADANASVKVPNLEKLSYAEQTAQLAGLATKLGTQLAGMVNDATPAVVSVNALTQPTFESLAKEIERVARNLEKASS